MITSSILGLLVGFTLGLTGAGGGILAVPALVIGVGLSMTSAAPVALIAVGLAALAGALDGLRRHMVRYKAAIIMALTGGLISPVGLWLAQRLPEFWLMTLFAGVMCVVAYRMFKQVYKRPSQGNSAAPERLKPCMLSGQTGKFIWNPRSLATMIGIGAVSGLLTGLLGVGGGFVIVPLLQRFTNLKMHSIVATSLLVIALVSAITVTSAWSSLVNLPLAIWGFVALVITGMGLGRWISPAIAPQYIQMGFALVCVFSACIVFVNACKHIV